MKLIASKVVYQPFYIFFGYILHEGFHFFSFHHLFLEVLEGVEESLPLARQLSHLSAVLNSIAFLPHRLRVVAVVFVFFRGITRKG